MCMSSAATPSSSTVIQTSMCFYEADSCILSWTSCKHFIIVAQVLTKGGDLPVCVCACVRECVRACV